MPQTRFVFHSLFRAAFLAATVAGAAGLPVAADRAASAALLAKTKAPESCLVSDLAKGDKGLLFKGESADVLAPGCYRLHVPLAAAPLGTLGVGLIKVNLQADAASRTCSAVMFPANNEFADATLDFVLTEEKRVPVLVEWRAEESQKTKGLLGKRALDMRSAGAAAGPGDAKDGGDELALDVEGADVPFADAIAKPYHLLAAGLHIERLSPIVVTVRTDMMVYRPGAKGGATVTLANRGSAQLQVALTVELAAGVAVPVPLKTETRELAPGASETVRLTDLFDTQPLYWGAEVRATATAPGVPPATARDIFGVSRSPWELAAIAAHPAHMAAFDDMKRAQLAATELRDKGFTGYEAFFWAPCDLLEFTPDQEDFFSGQTGYPGTLTGTRNLLTACHEQGLVGTFYANLWGGSGPPAFEVMRRHPEWFGNANYSTSVLDDWDLLGASSADMKNHKIRAPGIATWCFNQLYVLPPEGVIRYHANEIIQSQKSFGWDGIRYDSYYSRYWSVRAMRLIRSLVEKQVPGFGFGYNSFAWADWKAGALDDMIGGGGMIMAEGIRIENSQNLEAWGREVLSWRDLIWAYGGHGPGMLFRDGTDEEEMTPLGIEYQAALILASGGHLYYNAVKSELGQYLPFALRYSEYLYNNRMRPLLNPEQVVTFDGKSKLMQWQPLARTLDLGGRQHRLVLHAIPQPVEQNPFKNKAMKAPAPLRQLPVSVKLPAGATVTGAWWLSPAPEPRHETCPVTVDAGTARLVLPETRIWSVIVLDYEADQGLPRPLTLKEKTDTYIQDWRVVGPFPNDLEMSSVKKVFAPEEKLDFTATYPGAGGRTLTWLRTSKPGAPALGRLPLDFRDALDCHDNAPGCAYAYTEIESDSDREAVLRGKADDTLALWVNGAPVEFKGGCGEFQDVDEGQAKVTLKKGRNTVLAKVCEKWLYWLLALRVSDADGNPLPITCKSE